MKDLTPLEKEFFLTMFSGKEENRDSEKEMAKAAAVLCEKKIKRAIELARQKKKGESCAPSNFSCSWPECECTVLKYNPQQIEELLNK